jgi:hypothetical protein
MDSLALNDRLEAIYDMEEFGTFQKNMPHRTAATRDNREANSL